MEALIFALMVAGIAMRKSAVDIPFIIRGKTPPSHERRMREMAAREAAASRRQASRDRRVKARQRRRNTPVRRYVRGVWDHAWEQAAARRVIRWQERDPIKAEAYRDKVRARAAGDIRGGFFPWAWRHSRQRATDAGRQAWERARTRYRNARRTEGAADTGGHANASHESTAGAAEASEAPEDEIWDAEVVDEPVGPEPAHVGYPHEPGYLYDCPACEARCHCKPGDAECVYDGPHRPGGWTGTEQPPPSGRPSEPPADATGPEPPTPTDTGAAPGHPRANPDTERQEGNNPMDTTGEVTGLTDALTLTESWERETGQAVSQLEAAIAALEGAEVGPEVTGPFATAMEAFSSAHDAFAQARAGLQGSVNVGEAYQAAPGAGSKQFVTS